MLPKPLFLLIFTVNLIQITYIWHTLILWQRWVLWCNILACYCYLYMNVFKVYTFFFPCLCVCCRAATLVRRTKGERRWRKGLRMRCPLRCDRQNWYGAARGAGRHWSGSSQRIEWPHHSLHISPHPHVFLLSLLSVSSLFLLYVCCFIKMFYLFGPSFSLCVFCVNPNVSGLYLAIVVNIVVNILEMLHDKVIRKKNTFCRPGIIN